MPASPYVNCVNSPRAEYTSAPTPKPKEEKVVDEPKFEQDREAAQQALKLGAEVIAVRVEGNLIEVKALADLPTEPFRLTYVNLARKKAVRDEDLVPFKDCTELTNINLSETQVTDAGLGHLKNCKKFDTIDLFLLKRVTDRGFENFRGCENLVRVQLGFTGVTDLTLKLLEDCKRLEVISGEGANFTPQGIEALKTALPRCMVITTPPK